MTWSRSAPSPGGAGADLSEQWQDTGKWNGAVPGEGNPARSRDLGSMIRIGPFQLEILCVSRKS